MYIFAGQDPHSGTLFNDVFKVDLKALKLQRVEVKGGSPPPRHSHTSVPLNEKCMVRRQASFVLVFAQKGNSGFLTKFFFSFLVGMLLKAGIRRRGTRGSAK